ncbi:MAG: hypothetical protein L0214_15620 [candidate division NC10 bacterium]|nr:hypothetical protein [candidate division NC10 bacterium]
MAHRSGTLLLLILTLLVAGCGWGRFPSSASAPGVPRVSNLRVVPEAARPGEVGVLAFDFTDVDADIVDVYVEIKEVADFSISTGFEPVLLSRRKYFGQAQGTAQEAVRWSREGLHLYEIFVVDQEGHVSNRLTTRVVIR